MMDPFQMPMCGPMSGAISWELGPNGWSAKQHKSSQQQNLWFPVSASYACASWPVTSLHGSLEEVLCLARLFHLPLA